MNAVSFLRAAKYYAAIIGAARSVPTGRSLAVECRMLASVRLKVAKVGFIVGVGGGSGTLTFKGETVSFVA